MVPVNEGGIGLHLGKDGCCGVAWEAGLASHMRSLDGCFDIGGVLKEGNGRVYILQAFREWPSGNKQKGGGRRFLLL